VGQKYVQAFKAQWLLCVPPGLGLSKKVQISIFIVISPEGAEFHANGRETDVTKLTVAFAILRTRLKIIHSVYTMDLYVLCGSENKQRLFHYTPLTEWF
jgi:hypothetical protein